MKKLMTTVLVLILLTIGLKAGQYTIRSQDSYLMNIPLSVRMLYKSQDAIVKATGLKPEEAMKIIEKG